MAFIQVIEYETADARGLDALMQEWVTATEGKRTATREVHAEDRDHPGRYVDIVEFPSYESAMRNSALPETQRIAARMQELCTDDVRFMNLNVLSDEDLHTTP